MMRDSYVRLDAKETTTIVRALEVAAEVYRNDAKQVRAAIADDPHGEAGNLERIAIQFDRQAQDADDARESLE